MVRLTVEQPNRKARTFSYDAPAELTVGRGADSTFCLDFDPLVSRAHALFLIAPPSVRIRDLNSTNGIVINGELFGASGSRRLLQPLELRDGDVVQIGRTRFTVGVGLAFDPGPELLRIIAEQEAEQGAGPGAEGAADRRRALRFPAQDLAGGGGMLAARAKGGFDTIADAASVCPEVPGYSVERFLAAGRLGNVYKARPAAGGGAVVLKTTSFPGGELTRTLVEDFRGEMEARRRLSHEGLAALLAYGEVGRDTLYAVSEYVNGEALLSYLARCPGGKIPVPAALKLFRRLTAAAAYLHGLGFVHREIHPAGIMLHAEDGVLRAKFTESGLFRFWSDSGLGARGIFPGDTGRLGYLAPEELPQDTDSKPGADVFSLGCVMYHMLSGRVPYEFGPDATPLRVVEEARLRPIETLAADVPETVAVILDRALAPEPEMRYPSAREMLDAIEMISD